jgi:hypothetical protein
MSISLVAVIPTGAAPLVSKYPTFSIVSVVADKNVTIETYNFPEYDSFDVLFGKMGTRGVNGIKVATISSGSGGSFTKTFNIPNALKGEYQIAIRLQSNTGSGYYAYNWFYNNTTGSSNGNGSSISDHGYTGYPTITIKSVVRNKNVTVEISNMPPDDKFKVLMGPMGTRGKNGYKVETFNTGDGGKERLTFEIPSQLKGSYKISIRLESVTGSSYYAYNWFYNNTTK